MLVLDDSTGNDATNEAETKQAHDNENVVFTFYFILIIIFFVYRKMRVKNLLLIHKMKLRRKTRSTMSLLKI